MDTSKHSSSISSFKENGIFLVKAAGLFLGLVLFFFFVLMPQYEGEYNAVLNDKVDRLMSVEGPKMVFLGASEMAFGLRSADVQAAFGMPVVNMGMHGSLGNVFEEELARLNVTPGDIYVLDHLNYADGYNWGQTFNPVVMWTTVENQFRLWPLVWAEEDGRAVRPAAGMIEAFPAYIKNSLNRYFSLEKIGGPGEPYYGPYIRAAFNEYGDNVYPRPQTGWVDDTMFQGQDAPTVGEHTAERLNELAHWLEERGATLVITCNPIACGGHTPPLEEYEATQRELEEKLDCPVISRYEDYMLGYEYFFDGINHLNDEGAALYTQQMIKDLRAWMEESGCRRPQ